MSPSEGRADEHDLPDDEVTMRWNAIVAELGADSEQTVGSADPPRQDAFTSDARAITARHFVGPRDWEVTEDVSDDEHFTPPQEFEPLQAAWPIRAAWGIIGLGAVIFLGLLMSGYKAPTLVLPGILIVICVCIAFLLSQLPASRADE